MCDTTQLYVCRVIGVFLIHISDTHLYVYQKQKMNVYQKHQKMNLYQKCDTHLYVCNISVSENECVSEM